MKVIRKFEIVCEDKADATDIERYLENISNINCGIQSQENKELEIPTKGFVIVTLPILYYRCRNCCSIINSENLNLEVGDVREGVICPVCKNNITIEIMSGGVIRNER